MATFSACLVLTVATVCFAITYTTCINQLRDVGSGYAESLVTRTALSVSDYLDFPAAQARAVAKTFQREDLVMPLPSNDPFQYRTMSRSLAAFLPMFTSVFSSTLSVGISFDDGSFAYIHQINNATQAFGLYMINNGLATNATSGLGPFVSYGYDGPTSWNAIEYMPGDRVTNTSAYSGITTAYRALRPYFTAGDHGFWIVSELLDFGGAGPTFVFGGAFPVRNQSHLLGIGSLYIRIDALTDFFATVRATPGTELFAVDTVRAITATTHPASFVTQRNVNLAEALLLEKTKPGNCWSTATLLSDAARSREDHFVYACRATAIDYPYAPLQSAAVHDDLFWFTEQVVMRTLDVDGEAYYVAAAKISTSLQLSSVDFPMHLLLFMPQNDVVGDVVRIRSVTLGIVAGVFVGASVLAAAVIFFVLRPIRRMAREMTRKSEMRSRDASRETSLSSMFATAEVEHLKTAFDRMREAMDSFERYVPRTVVKELIGAGNLCHIAMEHRACTMMFTQISRFGDMCDTVSMDLLAPLLQQYFARVSGIAASRDGVVDKFIGDTIMIVWGAPKETADREKKAVLSGLLILRSAKDASLREGFRAIGEKLRIRLGVASGLVLAGNMGSSERMNYSVIGDAVNAASQLLDVCRQLSSRFLIDEATQRGSGTTFCTRKLLASFSTSQTSNKQPIFEVLGTSSFSCDSSLNTPTASRGVPPNAFLPTPASSLTIGGAPTTTDDRSASPSQPSINSDSTPPPSWASENEFLAASENVAQAAHIVSAATDAYLQQRFDECITLLESLDEHGFRIDTAVSRLRSLAELAARSATYTET